MVEDASIRRQRAKSERRAAHKAVATFHEVQLAQLVEHVAAAIDRYRAGELDAFDMDRVMFQYSRAAKQLWKFCNLSNAEIVAHAVRDSPPTDWWERGAARQR